MRIDWTWTRMLAFRIRTMHSFQVRGGFSRTWQNYKKLMFHDTAVTLEVPSRSRKFNSRKAFTRAWCKRCKAKTKCSISWFARSEHNNRILIYRILCTTKAKEKKTCCYEQCLAIQFNWITNLMNVFMNAINYASNKKMCSFFSSFSALLLTIITGVTVVAEKNIPIFNIANEEYTHFD